jgi:FG-GAP-like repeat/FG-GAP repeat
MKVIRALAAMAALFLPSIVFGQNYTSITAINLPLTSGQMCFLGTDNQDNPISYTAGDGTVFDPNATPPTSPVCATITNGSIGTGFQVANPQVAIPSTLLYRVYLQNGNSYPLIIRGVQISGESWSYSGFVLPSTETSLGFGPPTIACDAGAQYTQTDATGSPAWTCVSTGSGTQWQTYPNQGYCPTNSAYVTPKTGQPFCIAYQKEGIGAPTGACTENGFYFQKDSGKAWLWGCVNGAWTQLQSSKGTVTSIALNSPNPQVNITGSPIEDSGTINISLATTGNGSELVTANAGGVSGNCPEWDNGNLTDAGGPCVTYTTEPADTVFAAPDGKDGLPSFLHLTTGYLPFTYSGSTSELATVSGTLISGSPVVVGANGNITNATASSSWPGIIPNPSQVHGLAPSATIDTTNASNITSGTLNPARLPSIEWTCPSGSVISGFNLADNANPTCETASGTVTSASFGFIPYYSQSPTGNTISADTAFKTDGNGNLVANSLQILGLNHGTVAILPLGGSNAGCLFTDGAGNITSTHAGCGVNGTVSSVGLQDASNTYTITNQPITSSGTMTMTPSSQAAHASWRGPLSGSGAPTWRVDDIADLPANVQTTVASQAANLFWSTGSTAGAPGWHAISTSQIAAAGTLSNNTSGNAATATALAAAPTTCTNGQSAGGVDAHGNAINCVSSGGVSSVGAQMNGATADALYTVSGSPITNTGKLDFTLNAFAPHAVLIGPGSGSTSATPTVRTLNAADISSAGTLSNSTAGNAATATSATTAAALAATPKQCNAGQIATGIAANGDANCGNAGAVTSVGLEVNSTTNDALYAVSGSPITTAGSLNLTLKMQTPNTFFRGSSSGTTAAAPTWGALVTADLPSQIFKSTPTPCASGFATGIDTFGNAVGCAGAGAGSVTSVDVAVPAYMTSTGGPITNSGTITVGFGTQAANTFLRAPNGTAGVPGFGGIVASDLPGAIASQIHEISGTCNPSLPTSFSTDPITFANCQNNGGSGTTLSAVDWNSSASWSSTTNLLSNVAGVNFYNVRNPGAGTAPTSSILSIPLAVVNPTFDNIIFKSGGTVTSIIPQGGGLISSSLGMIGFQSGSLANASSSGSPDSALSRCGEDCLAIGNGVQGNASGQLQLSNLNFGSSVGNMSLSGGNLLFNLASGVNAQFNSGIIASGAAILNNTLSVASTSNLNATNFGANATLLALNPATSTNNFGSTSLQFKGSFWNGTAPADAIWTVQNQVGSGNNPSQTLQFTPSGSSGGANVSVPNLTVTSQNGDDGCASFVSGNLVSVGIPCGSGGSGSGGGTVTNVSTDTTGTANLFTTSVLNPTTIPKITFSLADAPAHTWFGNNSGGSATPGFNPLTAADIPTLTSNNLPSDVAYTDVANSFTAAQTMQNLTVTGTLAASALTGGKCVQTGTGGSLTVTSTACQQGTVTSVTVAVPSTMTVTNPTVTGSGTVTLGTNGTGTGMKLATATTVGTPGHSVTWTSTGDLGDSGNVAGTVTSVNVALPTSLFTMSGGPITTSGTITGTLNSQSAGLVFASPAAAAGVPTMRNLVTTDMPTNVFKSTPITCPSSYSIGVGVSGNAVCLNQSYAMQQLGGQSESEYIVSGDFNGDGLPDLAVANGARTSAAVNGSVSIFLESTTGAYFFFQSYQLSTTSTFPAQGIAVGDVNGDGKQDLVVTFSNTSSTAGYVVFLGNGDGTFASQGVIPIGANNMQPVLADFNGDGHLDMAFPSFNNSLVYVLFGNNNGTFTLNNSYSPGTNFGPVSIAVADFNKDGFPDMAIANFSTTSPGTGTVVSIYYGSSTGTFTLHSNITTTMAGSLGLSASDINGDGWPDLAVMFVPSNTSLVTGTIQLWTNNQTGGFSTQQTITGWSAQNVGIAPQMVLKDINGDGFPDLVFGSSGGNSINIYYGSNSGIMTFANSIIVGPGPTSNPANVIAGSFLSSTQTNQSLAVVNNATNTIDVLNPTGPQPIQNPLAYVATNTNQNITGQKTFSALVMLNNAEVIKNQGYGDTWKISSSAPSVGNGTFSASPVNYTAGTTALGVVHGDFNKDRFNDVLVSNYGSGTIQLLLNNGDGTFAAQSPISVISGNPIESAVADFNLDGNLDAATISLNGSISIFLGNGNGTFQAPFGLTATAGGNFNGLAVGDVNNDGYPDIATYGDAVSCGSHIPQMFINNTHGGFKTPTNITTASGSGNGISLADMNGDGYLDMIIAGGCGAPGNPMVAGVFLNDGASDPGIFAVGVGYPAAGNPMDWPGGFIIADVNQDGHPDVAMKQRQGNVVNVWFGTASGTLGGPTTYTISAGSTANTPIRAAAGSLHGDLYPDLVFGNNGADSFSVLTNKWRSGGSGFATHVDYAISGPVSYVDLADINGAGVLSAIVAGAAGGVTVDQGQGAATTTNTLSFEHTSGVANGQVSYPSIATGSFVGGVRTVAATDTATVNDYTILVNAAVTETLPASPYNGQVINVKNTGAASSVVTISGNGHSIDGQASMTLTNTSTDQTSAVLQYSSTSSAWFILASH